MPHCLLYERFHARAPILPVDGKGVPLNKIFLPFVLEPLVVDRRVTIELRGRVQKRRLAILGPDQIYIISIQLQIKSGCELRPRASTSGVCPRASQFVLENRELGSIRFKFHPLDDLLFAAFYVDQSIEEAEKLLILQESSWCDHFHRSPPRCAIPATFGIIQSSDFSFAGDMELARLV